MSELAKCPLCGEAPSVGATDREGLSWEISCCDATFVFQSHWNRYAAAIDAQTKLDELRERVAWERECDECGQWLSGAWFDNENLDLSEIWELYECARKAVEDLL